MSGAEAAEVKSGESIPERPKAATTEADKGPSKKDLKKAAKDKEKVIVLLHTLSGCC